MKENTLSTRRAAVLVVWSTASLALSSGAHASAVIESIQLVSDQVGALVTFDTNNETNIVQLQKTFPTLQSIDLRFTVGHATSGGNQFAVLEQITNNTGVTWSEYHVAIESALDTAVFTSIGQTTLIGFELDAPPHSGTHNLNYSGSLAAGEDTGAAYFLELPDPGAGNSYTFDLIQTPTTSVVPVPSAAWLLGTGVIGLCMRVRKKAIGT